MQYDYSQFKNCAQSMVISITELTITAKISAYLVDISPHIVLPYIKSVRKGKSMSNRDFSSSIKLEVIKSNLEKYNGRICCEICGTTLFSIKDCHFDHIHPFAKGGKSTLENCQLLCMDCNLKKNDKEFKDFVLEEKARQFLQGVVLTDSEPSPVCFPLDSKDNDMSKELFDQTIATFIKKKGNINKVDFGREYNKLPSFRYVELYYGGLINLKKEFGIEDLSYSWNRETIKEALQSYVSQHGDISQKDMKKANKLPSIPCVLNYYPEYKSFTDVKSGLCNLDVPINWTKENAIDRGREFALKNGKLSETDLKSANGLPTSKVIYRLFGSLANYQTAVGTFVLGRNEYISKADIVKAVDEYFSGRERIIETPNLFFESFNAVSRSTIIKRYGNFATFCEEHGIKVLVSKKTKYTKREVDDIISKWIKDGNEIPPCKDLSKLGLPSRDVILRYYEDWKEPFYIYKKLYEELGRH